MFDGGTHFLCGVLMTEQSIKSWIEKLKYRQYTTGIMHVATPQWLEDIRELIKCVEYLLEHKDDSK